MSWSVNRKGKPSEVKEQLVQDFLNAKNGTSSVPVEQQAVEKAEELTNLLLDDMIASEHAWVTVSGHGSGNITNPIYNWKGNVSFNLTVTPSPTVPE